MDVELLFSLVHFLFGFCLERRKVQENGGSCGYLGAFEAVDTWLSRGKGI